jgi:ferrous iron transport protein A
LEVPSVFASTPVENDVRLFYNQYSLLRLVLNYDKQSCLLFSAMRLIPLAVLRCGEVAEIHEVVGSAEHVRRLEELGLRSGSLLEMVRSGSPCIIRVGGSKLCIRNDESLRVLVAPRKTA